MYSNKTFSILATALAVAFAAFTATAVEPSQEVRKYANYYYAYPYPEKPLPEISKAPAGYEPFHMEHYGRHGSRWHVDQSVYQRPIDLLRPAEKAGKLSQRGKETMAKLRVTEKQARDRAGELTPLGARQHQGIGARMARNFPEIFGKPIHIDAKSTEVIRCILSMDNEVQALKAYNPDLDIATDASHSTMYYMNFEDSVANAARTRHCLSITLQSQSFTTTRNILSTLSTQKTSGTPCSASPQTHKAFRSQPKYGTFSPNSSLRITATAPLPNGM